MKNNDTFATFAFITTCLVVYITGILVGSIDRNPASWYCHEHGGLATSNEAKNNFTCNDGSSYSVSVMQTRAKYPNESGD